LLRRQGSENPQIAQNTIYKTNDYIDNPGPAGQLTETVSTGMAG